MNFILLLISLLGIVGGYFYFDYKLSLARKQQMIASNQYATLRESYKKLVKNRSTTNMKNKTNISVKFSTPPSKGGITNSNISLYLAPLYEAPTIKDINIRMEASILDSAEVNNEIWFYVALPIDTNINSRGWVNISDFSTIYNTSRNVSNSY